MHFPAFQKEILSLVFSGLAILTISFPHLLYSVLGIQQIYSVGADYTAIFLFFSFILTFITLMIFPRAKDTYVTLPILLQLGKDFSKGMYILVPIFFVVIILIRIIFITDDFGYFLEVILLILPSGLTLSASINQAIVLITKKSTMIVLLYLGINVFFLIFVFLAYQSDTSFYHQSNIIKFTMLSILFTIANYF